MEILIIFDTYSGGTLDAATYLYDELTRKNHKVLLKRPSEVTLDQFSSPDLVIFGTPSWLVDNIEGKPHTNFIKLMETMKDSHLKEKNIAIFGLGDESYAHFCEGVDILEKFIKEKQGNIITKSLKLNSYYTNQEECHKKITAWIESMPLVS